MPAPDQKRNQIIEAINSPLGFFVLALLIVELFLATVLVGSDLDATHKVYGMYLGVGMFVLVVAVVSTLVRFKADYLTYDKEAHLRDKGKPPFGTDDHTPTNPASMVPIEPKVENK